MSSPILTLPQIPKNLDPEMRDYLTNLTKILVKKQNEEYGTLEKRIIDRLYPIGERYVQFPEPDGTFDSNKSPEVKFGGEWVCIFNDEGVFFRTEGGNASESRGGTGIQGDVFKSHNHTGALPSGPIWFKRYNYGGGWPSELTPGDFNSRYTGSTGNANETRPKNRLMRIWERIA